jgi:hypothetical protein
VGTGLVALVGHGVQPFDRQRRNQEGRICNDVACRLHTLALRSWKDEQIALATGDLQHDAGDDQSVICLLAAKIIAIDPETLQV